MASLLFSFISILFMSQLLVSYGFLSSPLKNSIALTNINHYNLESQISIAKPSDSAADSSSSYGSRLVTQRNKYALHDLLGFGPAEIAITLVLGLVLFGPETLKSLSKDVGRAAAELKEIPKTFKEGMEEGQQTSQVTRMKMLAAEKRKKRDEKLAASSSSNEEEDEEGDDDEDNEVVDKNSKK